LRKSCSPLEDQKLTLTPALSRREREPIEVFEEVRRPERPS